MNIEFKPNNFEQKKSEGLELFKLNEQKKKELKERVAHFQGLARIFVHPVSTNGDTIENEKRVKDVLRRTSFSKDSPPIIILENSEYLDSWKKMFKEKDLPNDIYLVPTIYDYPYPLIPNKISPTKKDGGILKDEDFNYVEEGFKNFLNFLNDVGVEKVLVGGTKLEVTNGNLNRCVGNFISFFKHYTDAEIKLSLGTAPLNRNDIRASNPDLI